VWFAFCCSSEASLTGGRSLRPETGATRAGGRHPRWSSCGGEERCSPWPRTSLLVGGRRSCEWRPRKAATGSSVCCKCMFGVFLRFRKNVASVSYLCCNSRSWCCKNWYWCCNVAKVDLDVADVVFKCCVCCFLMLRNFLSMLRRDGLMLRRDLDFSQVLQCLIWRLQYLDLAVAHASHFFLSSGRPGASSPVNIFLFLLGFLI
jgi:hypothetical protein